MAKKVEPISFMHLGGPVRAYENDTSGFASPAYPGTVLARIQALGYTRGQNLSLHEVREKLDAMIAERRYSQRG